MEVWRSGGLLRSRVGKRDQGPALLVVLSDGLLLVHRDTG